MDNNLKLIINGHTFTGMADDDEFDGFRVICNASLTFT